MIAWREYSPFARMMRNPHYYSGAIVSRAATYMATIIWAVYGLIDARDGLIDGREMAPYPMMAWVMPLALWACVGGTAALIQLIRLMVWSKPRFAGGALNAALCFFWVFVAFSRAGYSGPGTACIAVIAFLSLCAFVSSPKDRDASI